MILSRFCLAAAGIVSLSVPIARADCIESGGTVTTANCCLGGSDFPNTCLIGACGCSPENSEETQVCYCPGDLCFDGNACVSLANSKCTDVGGTVETLMCCKSVSDFPNTCVIGACGCAPDDSHEVKICSCPEGGDPLCWNGDTCVVDRNNDLLSEYFTLDTIGGGCIGIESIEPGSKLRLLECVSDNDAIQWSLDNLNRFHSKLDEDMCMTANHGNSARDGSIMRIYECSDSKFQQFDDSFESAGLSGPIMLASKPELCVVSRGVHRDIGVDPIILKECANLDHDRAIGWEGDDPCTHPPVCNDSP